MTGNSFTVDKPSSGSLDNFKTKICSGHELKHHVQHSLTEIWKLLFRHCLPYFDKMRQILTIKFYSCIKAKLLFFDLWYLPWPNPTLNKFLATPQYADVWACDILWPLSSDHPGTGPGRRWTWQHQQFWLQIPEKIISWVFFQNLNNKCFILESCKVNKALVIE